MIRKSLVVVLGLVLCSAVFAAAKGKSVSLTGYVIDNACAAKHAKDANVADEIKGHPTKCALMAPCVKSGYAVYADGKLYKLDKAGSEKAEELLKNTKSQNGLQVKVDGSLSGDTITVKSISEVS